jgi:hypothetical protein
MTMTSNVVKFPYDACRRVHSKKPRRSKNGTPEERAAGEQMDPWPEVGQLLRELESRKLLRAGLDCWRLLLERRGTAS